MAYNRTIRSTGASYSSGGTQPIDGLVGFEYEFTPQAVKFGEADGDVGYTSASITGWIGRLTLTLDDMTEALNLIDLAAVPVELTYQSQQNTDGAVTARTANFDSVIFTEVNDFALPERSEGSEVMRYRVSGEVLFATSDTLPSDTLALANDT